MTQRRLLSVLWLACIFTLPFCVYHITQVKADCFSLPSGAPGCTQDCIWSYDSACEADQVCQYERCFVRPDGKQTGLASNDVEFISFCISYNYACWPFFFGCYDGPCS